MAMTIHPYKIYNTNTVFEVTDDFDIDNMKDLVKSQQLKQVPDAVFEDDPVALSITSYLIWKSNPRRRWIPVTEVGRVTPEAREMAHELRKYFLQRSTMKILQGQTPTEFQYKLNAFLSDIRPLKEDELGMLYRLPYFWQEDLALDQIFEGAPDIPDDNPFAFNMTTHTTLAPVREVLRSRRNGDFVQFWFAGLDGQRYVYDVKSDNKLLSIFRSLFKRPELAITGYAKLERLRGSHIRTRYWRLTNLGLNENSP